MLTLVCVIGVISCLIGQYIQLPYSMIQGLTAIPFLYIGYVAKNNNSRSAQLGRNIRGTVGKIRSAANSAVAKISSKN